MIQTVGHTLMIMTQEIEKLIQNKVVNKSEIIKAVDRLASRTVSAELKKIMVHSVWKDVKRRA
jgi:hypothetical protein